METAVKMFPFGLIAQCFYFRLPHLLPLHPLEKQTSQNEEETLQSGSANVGSSLQELAQEVQDEKRDVDGMVQDLCVLLCRKEKVFSQ